MYRMLKLKINSVNFSDDIEKNIPLLWKGIAVKFGYNVPRL